MRAKGYADAREFEQATILFTDFKGFTAMAEVLSAGDLVKEYRPLLQGLRRHHRSPWDRGRSRPSVMRTWPPAGYRTLRTEGPATWWRRPWNRREYMEEYKKQREAAGLPLRDAPGNAHRAGGGRHRGRKKYAYDIWGHGEHRQPHGKQRCGGPGEHQRDTYALVRDDPRFSFTHRGRVQAMSGKGEMDMYFVTGPEPHRGPSSTSARFRARSPERQERRIIRTTRYRACSRLRDTSAVMV